jgi:hypothetical protein
MLEDETVLYDPAGLVPLRKKQLVTLAVPLLEPAEDPKIPPEVVEEIVVARE